jgi:tetratricopeptide (TPR) repeat protein
MDRLATFRTFIARSPADPFPRYGLAMEHKGRGELAEAWTAFEELLTKFPDYVATYLQAGGTLVALGRKDEAATIYRTGIEVATTRGDQHARRELESALQEIAPEQEMRT